jgi:Tfp pilus assembly protein PilV
MKKIARSFTLVETMVAVSIVTIAITGPLYQASKAYTNSVAARDQLVAIQLAQEGAEHIIAMRDDNYLYTLANPAAPHTWLYGMSSCQSPSFCTVDLNQSAPFDIGTQLTPLYLNSNYLFTQQQALDSSKTIFSRKVQIITVAANREVQVNVTVTWRNKQGSHTTTVVDYVTNWL